MSVKNLIGAATRESVFHPFDDRNRYQVWEETVCTTLSFFEVAPAVLLFFPVIN